ncbi:uncharacterized protein V1516DRAFT_688985 [Lipomyces oligophaga]|uniref:uncharacterized protein n=1 Tax=Lipomyces oligophaga TaxID=45792 RepID=UPI0034CEBA58
MKIEENSDVDYYGILNLSNMSCSAEEVRKAYKRLALLYHPDKTGNHPDASEKFKAISEANAVLCDPTKRAIYDSVRRRAQSKKSTYSSASAYNPNYQAYASPYRRETQSHSSNKFYSSTRMPHDYYRNNSGNSYSGSPKTPRPTSYAGTSTYTPGHSQKTRSSAQSAYTATHASNDSSSNSSNPATKHAPTAPKSSVKFMNRDQNWGNSKTSYSFSYSDQTSTRTTRNTTKEAFTEKVTPDKTSANLDSSGSLRPKSTYSYTPNERTYVRPIHPASIVDSDSPTAKSAANNSEDLKAANRPESSKLPKNDNVPIKVFSSSKFNSTNRDSKIDSSRTPLATTPVNFMFGKTSSTFTDSGKVPSYTARANTTSTPSAGAQERAKYFMYDDDVQNIETLDDDDDIDLDLENGIQVDRKSKKDHEGSAGRSDYIEDFARKADSRPHDQRQNENHSNINDQLKAARSNGRTHQINVINVSDTEGANASEDEEFSEESADTDTEPEIFDARKWETKFREEPVLEQLTPNPLESRRLWSMMTSTVRQRSRSKMMAQHRTPLPEISPGTAKQPTDELSQKPDRVNEIPVTTKTTISGQSSTLPDFQAKYVSPKKPISPQKRRERYRARSPNKSHYQHTADIFFSDLFNSIPSMNQENMAQGAESTNSIETGTADSATAASRSKNMAANPVFAGVSDDDIPMDSPRGTASKAAEVANENINAAEGEAALPFDRNAPIENLFSQARTTSETQEIDYHNSAAIFNVTPPEIPVPPSIHATEIELADYWQRVLTYQSLWNEYQLKVTLYFRERQEADSNHSLQILSDSGKLDDYIRVLQQDERIRALWDAALKSHKEVMVQLLGVRRMQEGW